MDPYKVIENFFSFAPVEQHRKYIYSMLTAAYSEDYWRKSDPGELLLFQQNMIDLIKATYLFASGEKKSIRKKMAVVEKGDVDQMIDPATYFGRHQGNAMWAFFPRYLSRKEFINPYLAVEKFFDFRSLDRWLTEFKELINYALSPYGNESALEFDYLKINNLLQKLNEASHLIHVRVNKPVVSASFNKDLEASKEDPGDDETDSEEIENYTSDPYKIIDGFFLDGDVQDGRDDVSRLFEAAFPDDLIEKKNYPSVLVFTFESIGKLIDAAQSINLENESYTIDEAHMGEKILAQVKTLYKKTGKWDLFPYKLKPYEWVYPRLAIRAFFEHQPISHWKGKLHEILQAAISDNSICSVISDRSRLYLDCDHLERLVEAMWVIKIMEL